MRAVNCAATRERFSWNVKITPCCLRLPSQETETCMVRACDTPQQPLRNHPQSQNHSSGHLGGWSTLCYAEKVLDGQHQRVDISAHARTVDKGLLPKKKTGRESLLNLPSCPPDDQIGQGTELN